MICWSCRAIKQIAYTDEVERGYCLDCARSLPVGGYIAALEFLDATVPFKVGDRVECRTAASFDEDERPTSQVYDGIGRVIEVSTNLKDLATPVFPMFRVAIDEKAYPDAPDERWYSEMCLEPVKERVS